MCNGGLGGRPLSLNERRDQLEREISVARRELEELPARIAWLEKQHDALKAEAQRIADELVSEDTLSREEADNRVATYRPVKVRQ